MVIACNSPVARGSLTESKTICCFFNKVQPSNCLLTTTTEKLHPSPSTITSASCNCFLIRFSTSTGSTNYAPSRLVNGLDLFKFCKQSGAHVKFLQHTSSYLRRKAKAPPDHHFTRPSIGVVFSRFEASRVQARGSLKGFYRSAMIWFSSGNTPRDASFTDLANAICRGLIIRHGDDHPRSRERICSAAGADPDSLGKPGYPPRIRSCQDRGASRLAATHRGFEPKGPKFEDRHRK
jgi:hypothetical protein